MVVQHRLNLPQFNAETADFHLMIHSAQKLDFPVCLPSRQVARLIQARTLFVDKRITHKFFVGQLQPFEIAARQTIPANA